MREPKNKMLGIMVLPFMQLSVNCQKEALRNTPISIISSPVLFWLIIQLQLVGIYTGTDRNNKRSLTLIFEKNQTSF